MDLLSFYYFFDLFPNIAINVIFRLIQRKAVKFLFLYTKVCSDVHVKITLLR